MQNPASVKRFITNSALLVTAAISLCSCTISGGNQIAQIKVIKPAKPADTNYEANLAPEPPEPNYPVNAKGYIRIINDSGFNFGNAKNLHAAEYACQQLNVAAVRGFIAASDSGVGSQSNLSRTREIFFQGGPMIAGPLADKTRPGHLHTGSVLHSNGAALVSDIVKSWGMPAYGSSQAVCLQSSLPPGLAADTQSGKFYSGMLVLPRQPRPASNDNPIYFSKVNADDSGKARTGTLADFLGFNLSDLTRIYPGDFQYITLSRHYPDSGFMDSGRVGMAKLISDTDTIFNRLWQLWQLRPESSPTGKPWTGKDNYNFFVGWLDKNVAAPPAPLPPLAQFIDPAWLSQTTHQQEEFPLEAFTTKQNILSWMDNHPPLSAEGNNYYDLPNVGPQNSFNVKNLQRLSARLWHCLTHIDPDFPAQDLPKLLSSVKLPMGSVAYIYRPSNLPTQLTSNHLVIRLQGDPRISKEAPWINEAVGSTGNTGSPSARGSTTPYYGRRLVMFQWLINRSGDWVDKRHITMSGPAPGMFNNWDITAVNYQNACVHDKLSWTQLQDSGNLLAELKLQSFFAGCGDLSGSTPPESFPCVEARCRIGNPSPTSAP